MYRPAVAAALRILPVGMVALAIQRQVFAEHPVADVKIQFVLALVVAAGAGGGADRGAVAGFVLGLLYDATALDACATAEDTATASCPDIPTEWSDMAQACFMTSIVGSTASMCPENASAVSTDGTPSPRRKRMQ